MKFFIIVIELKKTFMCEKYCEIMVLVASRRVYIAITSQLQYFCTNGMHICFVLIVLKKNYVCTYINVREDLFLMITINFYRNLGVLAKIKSSLKK